KIDAAEFRPLAHEGIGVELCMAPNSALGLLHLLTNDPVFIGVIERLTGCGPVGCFGGRVYRMVASSGHSDSWHSDMARDEQRILGMSINLGEQPYSGGLFQLRRADSSRLFYEHANTGPGDALVFRLAPWLEHRVSHVVGNVPKTAFAGWFRTEP